MGLEDEDLVDDGDAAGGGKVAVSVSCSICLEVVTDNGDRSWAKLQCGHQFHLGCRVSVVQLRKGSMLNALAMLVPFCVLLGVIILWDCMSPSNLIANYPHMFVMGTGLAFGFLVGRMILAHLCDEPKGLKTGMSMSLLYLPLAIANTLTARINDGIPFVDEKWVLLGFCIYTAALYLHFATSVT